MPKCDFNFIKIALRHGCSPVNLLHISRTPFPKNTSGRLLRNKWQSLFVAVLKTTHHHFSYFSHIQHLYHSNN